MPLKRFRDLSFRAKLVIYSGLTTALTLAVAGVALIHFETTTYEADFERTIVTLADVAGRNCASAVAFDDPDFAERVLSGLGAESGIRAIIVFDAEGGVFASWSRDTDQAGGVSEENLFSVSQPILFGDKQLGTVRIEARPTDLAERIRLFTLAIFVLFAGAFIGSLVLAGLLQRGLSRPIVELQETADRVRRERDYEARARQFGHDELGELTGAFNEMLAEIQQRDVALRRSEARYSALLGRIDEVVFRMDLPDGNLVFCSPGAAQVFGHDADSLVEDPALLPSLIHEDSRESYRAMLASAADGDIRPALDYRIAMPSGQEKWINQTNYPVFDRTGRLVAVEGCFIEVTERVLAEREQDRLRDELAQAHKLEALGTLTGGIAHDFNNILSAIMGYASLALDDLPEGDPMVENVQPILTASERAAKLTRQILTFARQNLPERMPVDPAALLDEALDLVRASLPSTISIVRHIDDDLSQVAADATQLHQVFMNLCTNAQYAMKEKGGALEIDARIVDLDNRQVLHYAELETGRYVEVSVTDSGTGIAAEHLERIFEPFFTTKPKGEGTGMGLSVVYGIVREHGGVITVESIPGAGSTFRLLLPALGATAARPSATGSSAAAWGKGRVMVVDDEPVLAKLAGQMLKRLGCGVVTFVNPWLAWEAFEADPAGWDALVTDLTMPNLTGIELARKLIELRPELPVILVTGNVNRIEESDLVGLERVRIASKPYDLNTLGQYLGECLDRV